MSSKIFTWDNVHISGSIILFWTEVSAHWGQTWGHCLLGRSIKERGEGILNTHPSNLKCNSKTEVQYSILTCDNDQNNMQGCVSISSVIANKIQYTVQVCFSKLQFPQHTYYILMCYFVYQPAVVYTNGNVNKYDSGR